MLLILLYYACFGVNTVCIYRFVFLQTFTNICFYSNPICIQRLHQHCEITASMQGGETAFVLNVFTHYITSPCISTNTCVILVRCLCMNLLHVSICTRVYERLVAWVVQELPLRRLMSIRFRACMDVELQKRRLF